MTTSHKPDNRRMLEMAAKAIGKQRQLWDYEYCRSLRQMVTPQMLWNPFDRYGDAMEIALNLSFTIELSSGEFNYAEVRNHGGKVLGYSDNRECVNYACLAITRAAAAIGEAMP